MPGFATRLATPLAIALGVFSAATAGAQTDRLPDICFSFDQGTEGWSASAEDGAAATLEATRVGSGRTVLHINAKFPGLIDVKYTPWRDWQGYDVLSFDLQFGRGASKQTEPVVYLKDNDYWWYQAIPFKDPKTHKPTRDIPIGKWDPKPIRLDLRPGSPWWVPVGHKKPWGDALFKPKEFGVRFVCKEAWEGSIYLDNILLRDEEPDPPAPKGKIKVQLSAREVPEFEMLKGTFDLGKHYRNPYDPNVVDAMAHFKAPDGSTSDVSCFYYQPFDRSQDEQGHEILTPSGAPCWKVRFMPQQVGQYSFFITVKDDEVRESAPETFRATPARDPRGLVRIQKNIDPSNRYGPVYFEFDDDQFYYPIGLNVRDGNVIGDPKGQRGTYDMDHYFAKMHEAGLNFVRTWMCAWWTGLEWSESYHPAVYQGLGRYSMANAWRLDYTMDLAKKMGLYVELTLNNHGQLRRDKFDFEWEYNPFSAANGGWLTTPWQFWTDERAKELTRRRYRYIVARWGAFSNLMTWDMWNEVDLVEGYTFSPRDPVVAWHKEFADYLAGIDSYHHMITTHYCLYWLGGREMFGLPEMQYIQADSYWSDTIPQDMNKVYQSRYGIRKPFVIIEFSRNRSIAEQELRSGLWTSVCLPLSGTAVYWLWDEVDKLNLWHHFVAVEKFMAGEDDRSKAWKRTLCQVQPADYLAQAMRTDTDARIYVYNWEKLGVEPPESVNPVEGHTLVLRGLTPGAYEVEFWDTLSGTVSSKTSIVTDERGTLTSPIPPLRADVAIKIRKAQ
jgi:hypothetical protein